MLPGHRLKPFFIARFEQTEPIIPATSQVSFENDPELQRKGHLMNEELSAAARTDIAHHLHS